MSANVQEFIIDGVSGLSPSSQPGCMVAGVCSVGQIGKGYLLGPSSDLDALLGVGPLVERLKDIFASGGQNISVIAVPVSGSPYGDINIKHIGTGSDATITGLPVQNVDAVIEIVEGGSPGVAKYRISVYTGGEIIIDGGMDWGQAEVIPANGQIQIGTTGLVCNISNDVVAGDLYEITARLSIGMIYQSGSGPAITVDGVVRANADVRFKIISSGMPNIGTYQLSIDGGDNWGSERTIPISGEVSVGSTGVIIHINDVIPMVAGVEYSFKLYPPEPTISDVMNAIEQPLETYDVEFVYIAGPSDSTAWAALGAKSDELWNVHRPTFFIAETRLPAAHEDHNDWVASLVEEKTKFVHRFVCVCAAYGEVSDSSGNRLIRNMGGLLAGKILSIPPMSAIGKVKLGSISQAGLIDSYQETHQKQLETAGFITAKRYAGLNGVYWGDGRTLADSTSDYQYIEVLRPVFKAVRIARLAALKSIYDEAGDPIAEGGASGINALKASIEVALEQMTKALPPELAAALVIIPDGQDIVNNGISVQLELIGIPIIRKIRIYASYTYAGSSVDARLEG